MIKDYNYIMIHSDHVQRTSYYTKNMLINKKDNGKDNQLIIKTTRKY